MCSILHITNCYFYHTPIEFSFPISHPHRQPYKLHTLNPSEPIYPTTHSAASPLATPPQTSARDDYNNKPCSDNRPCSGPHNQYPSQRPPLTPPTNLRLIIYKQTTSSHSQANHVHTSNNNESNPTTNHPRHNTTPRSLSHRINQPSIYIPPPTALDLIYSDRIVFILMRTTITIISDCLVALYTFSYFILPNFFLFIFFSFCLIRKLVQRSDRTGPG